MRAASVRLAAPSLLADGFGEVVAHGALRKAEPFGDLRAAIAFARVAQHLAFAVGERVGFGSGFGGRFGIDHASPRANPPDGVGQGSRRRILQQVAGNAGIERAPQVPPRANKV
jgi:hypothetical protein